MKRVIQHFHFTTWPDFGVPSPPQTLARFVRAFRERVRPDQRPIVVHCSAGVGRSGTFITLDRILQQILVSKYVDIFGIVWAMRKERVWMVQTEQQYICIHQCLLAVLEGQDTTGPPREIHDNQGFEGEFTIFALPQYLQVFPILCQIYVESCNLRCMETGEAIESRQCLGNYLIFVFVFHN